MLVGDVKGREGGSGFFSTWISLRVYKGIV